MRILVFSDLHGNGSTAAERLTSELHPDWVVLCGEMLADFSNRPDDKRLDAQPDAQLDFWLERRGCFLREGTVTTFILGNHEQSGFQDAVSGGHSLNAVAIWRGVRIPGSQVNG